MHYYPAQTVLRWLLDNTGQSDTIYVGIYSPLQDAEYGLSYGIILNQPIFIEGFSSKSTSLDLASGQFIDIYWAFSPWTTSSSIKLAPNHDSVFISRNDTTTFSISF
jgi:hypothetical protein